MMQDRNSPAKVKEVLDAILAQFGLQSKVKEMEVLKLWPEVVGEPLSKHSRPASISRGRLFVKVDNSAWLTQLSHFKEKIILEFNKKKGEEVIKDIYFRVGRIYPSSPEKREARRLGKVKLSKQELLWIEGLLKRVKDENLRIALKRILLKHKKAQKLNKSRQEGEEK